MNYVFVGQNLLGGTCLDELLSHGLYPGLVITRLDNDYPNLVKQICETRGICLETTASLNSDQRLSKMMATFQPDFIYCCAWGDIIRDPLLALPRLGWVNFHPSLLPKYRGSRPIEWQLWNGETVGGVSAHFMVREADRGPILLQEPVAIAHEDNGETLRRRCGKRLGELAVKCYRLLSSRPDIRGVEQDESQATYAPSREALREIRCHRRAPEVYNQVRALAPFPCVFLRTDDAVLEIYEVTITAIQSGRHLIGQLRKHNDELILGTSDFFVGLKAIRLGNRIVRSTDTQYWNRLGTLVTEWQAGN